MQIEEELNPKPQIFEAGNHISKEQQALREQLEKNDSHKDEIDNYEVFDIVRYINDPEHPLTLEQLHIVQPERIQVDQQNQCIKLQFTPTIFHCSLA